MTVETTDRKQSFDGGQSALTFAFKTLPDHPEYIKVVVVSGGTETLLTYSDDYTVALESDGVGGVVTVSPSYSTAYTYTVYRDTTNKQESDYDDYNQFPADTLEEDLDRRTMIDQEQDEANDRTLKLPISSSLSNVEIPPPEADKVLGWNSDADAIENKDIGDLGAVEKASQAEAEALTDDSKYMTPAKSAYSVAAYLTSKLYDSGWFEVTINGSIAKTHGLGTTLLLTTIYLSDSDTAPHSKIITCTGDNANASSGTLAQCGIMALSDMSVTLRLGQDYLCYVRDNNNNLWAPTAAYARILMLALE